jgi:calmodulin
MNLAINLLNQLASLYSEQNTDYSVSYKFYNFGLAFDYLGKILSYFLAIDNVVARNEYLKEHWNKYRAMVYQTKNNAGILNITDEQRKDLQDIFDQFDKDKDGKISGKELANAMESMGQNPTDEEINEMMREVDLNQDGKIDFDEFMILMTKSSPDTQTEEEVINAFRVFDKEGNGLIASSELKHIMMTIGDKMTEEEAEEMVNEADIDEDGMINYEEFVRMMMAS